MTNDLLQERLRYCDGRTTRRLSRALQLSRMIWGTCCILLIKTFGFVLATVLTDVDHLCKFTAKKPHAKKHRWDDVQTATPTHFGKVKCHTNAIKGIGWGIAVRAFQIACEQNCGEALTCLNIG